MGNVTLLTTSEYEAQEFDAVLVREEAVVCVRTDDDLVRMVPLDKVNCIDGDPDTLLVDTEIPESFYGGGRYGFVEVDRFPDLQAHLDDLADEAY